MRKVGRTLLMGAALAAVSTGQVVAQQQPQNPETLAFSQKLMQEINANLQCTTQFITVQQKLTAAEAEIKQLKEKYEPAPK